MTNDDLRARHKLAHDVSHRYDWVGAVVKLTKRTEGSLRQKALKLGIRLGHRR
jgi:hypothetical protein